MADIVTTKSTSKVTSEILVDYIIESTATTRRVFRATVVDNPKDPTACISGVIYHQRKSPKEYWEDVKSTNLNTLKAGEGVKITLGCSEMKALRSYIEQAYAVGNKGVQPSISKLVVGKEDEVIIVQGKEREYIGKLLKQGLGGNIWEQLIEANPDLATKLSLARIQANRIDILAEFEASISGDKDESFWQQFLSQNDWIFGYGLSYTFTSLITNQVYVGGKDINNQGGQVCDFMAASNGDARFTILVEIKKPNTPLLDKIDRNRCYPVSRELGMALSQIQGYCETWGTNSTLQKYEYEKENNLFTIQPKGIILIGNTAELDNLDKKRSFELFRRHLHNIEILTYDELFARAKFITNPDSITISNVKEEETEFDDLPF